METLGTMTAHMPYTVVQLPVELTCVFCGRAATGPRQLLSVAIMSTGDSPNLFVHVECFRAALHPSFVDAFDLERVVLDPAP